MAEESGLELDTPGKLLNLINVNQGSYFYGHYLYVIKREELPELKPQTDESIHASHWVELKNIHFEKNSDPNNSTVASVIIEERRYQVKPYDNTAAHIAYAINCEQPQYGFGEKPSAAIYNPQYDVVTFGI